MELPPNAKRKIHIVQQIAEESPTAPREAGQNSHRLALTIVPGQRSIQINIGASRQKQATPDTAGLTYLRDTSIRIVPTRLFSRIFGTQTLHNLCRFFPFFNSLPPDLIDLERYSFSSIDRIGYDNSTPLHRKPQNINSVLSI